MKLDLLQIAVDLGLTPFNIVLIVMLYFMGAHIGIFPKFWKYEVGEDDLDDDGNEITLSSLYNQMRSLSLYFNHNTTESLQKLNEKQEKIYFVVEDIRRKHDEYDRFGIKIRQT